MAEVRIQPTPVVQPEMVVPDGVSVDAYGKVTIATAPAGNETPLPENRPEWLPTKFKSPEDMAKSYAELEKHFHAKTTPPVPPVADPAVAPTPEAPVTPPVAPVLDTATIESFGAEFVANGKLSEESYAALAAKGMDAATVNNYILGQQAIAAKATADLAATVGGEQQLAKVLEWSKANIPQEQLEAYEGALASGNMGLVKLALAGLNSAFRTAVPQEPTFVKGAPVALGAQGAQPFTSQDEVVAAHRDPRYKTDASYRAHVAARHAATP